MAKGLRSSLIAARLRAGAAQSLVRATRSFSTAPADIPPSIPKLAGRAAWHGSDLKGSEWWGKQITEEMLSELDAATTIAMNSGIEFEGDVPLGVKQDIFPLKKTADMLAALADELENGKGVIMLEGMPVDRYSVKELGVMYMGMCSYIGHLVNQSSAGLRSKSRGYGLPLGHIKAEMKGKTPLEGKQANNYFRLHTDRCDVISLLSIRTASRGGLARIASASAIHDEMLNRAPELVPLLYEPIERIWEGGEGIIALPIWATTAEGKFTTQISPSYIENAQYVNGVRKLTAGEIEAIDLIEEIGLEIGLPPAPRPAPLQPAPPRLQASRVRRSCQAVACGGQETWGHEFLQMPGQLTFINNHLNYHGRTAWKFAEMADKDNERDNEENGRLLLRAWVSPYNSRALPDTPEFNVMWGAVEGGVPRGGLEPAVAAGIKAKPPELIEAYASGRVDYYGMYKRKYAGEDIDL